MDKMCDMKMTKADMNAWNTPVAVGGAVRDQYPYGLELQLDASTIKKLNLAEAPEAGEEVMIHACCLVSRVSADANGTSSMSLQITKLALVSMEDDEANEDEAAWSKAKEARKARY